MREKYRTFVFDLDGTLVRLAVDWDAAADAVAAALRDRGIEPPDSLWAMLETADERGVRGAVEDVLSEHEREGAERSTRLPAADTVPSAPVGVCSLNCRAACLIALSEHEIGGIDTDAVVGRDTVSTEKPDPEPLLEAIRRLEGDPATTLFIGDTDRDATTAQRAGVDYADVSAWLRAYR